MVKGWAVNSQWLTSQRSRFDDQELTGPRNTGPGNRVETWFKSHTVRLHSDPLDLFLFGMGQRVDPSPEPIIILYWAESSIAHTRPNPTYLFHPSDEKAETLGTTTVTFISWFGASTDISGEKMLANSSRQPLAANGNFQSPRNRTKTKQKRDAISDANCNPIGGAGLRNPCAAATEEADKRIYASIHCRNTLSPIPVSVEAETLKSYAIRA